MLYKINGEKGYKKVTKVTKGYKSFVTSNKLIINMIG